MSWVIDFNLTDKIKAFISWIQWRVLERPRTFTIPLEDKRIFISHRITDVDSESRNEFFLYVSGFLGYLPFDGIKRELEQMPFPIIRTTFILVLIRVIENQFFRFCLCFQILGILRKITIKEFNECFDIFDIWCQIIRFGNQGAGFSSWSFLDERFLYFIERKFGKRSDLCLCQCLFNNTAQFITQIYDTGRFVVHFCRRPIITIIKIVKTETIRSYGG